MGPLKILTWHVHGSYLYYLSHVPHEFYVPVDSERSPGFVGVPPGDRWPSNLHEIPVEAIKDFDFDCIIYQSHQNYLVDQHRILTPEQMKLPRVFLEHDPPREHPTDTRHPVDDPNVLIVHVTHFNNLMWDSGRSPTRVIEHGVTVPEEARYTGELERGIVVINNIARRGRRLGADLFAEARRQVPLDLVGMGWEEAGGIGEVDHDELPLLAARYRFFYNPIRYTSLGLAILEAMMVGLPIIGLKTTELAAVIENGKSGHLSLDPSELVLVMQELLASPEEARRLGEGARQVARERYSIDRFVIDWCSCLSEVTGRTGVVRARRDHQRSLAI